MNHRLRALTIVPLGALLISSVAGAQAQTPPRKQRDTHLRTGLGRTIVAVHAPPTLPDAPGNIASVSLTYPRPHLAGFSSLVAIATSNKGHPLGYDLEFEHVLSDCYTGSLLNPSADPSFVIGYLDSGSDANLAAGSYAHTLGLFGGNLTENTIPIGGVGGQVDAYITMPVGFFAAGLSAVGTDGTLDFGGLVGHWNVCGLSAPAIDCGSGEVVTAIVGMPFLAFYNSVIRVDTPRSVTVGGVTYAGPDVQIQDPFDPLPTFPRRISMEFGGTAALLPPTTANYYPAFDDLEGPPTLPTLLSAFPGLYPIAGSFFATIYVVEGEPGSTNPAQPMRVLVDTGSQSSIMSPGMVANLSLPFEPDFTVDVCGVGGLVTGVAGYYVDYVRINAQGGALEFSQAPFVVLDLDSPEGGSLDGVLGMNFFWNRNVIFEPALGDSAFLHVSDPIPLAYGDFDVDLDVDVQDAELLAYCLGGSGAMSGDPVCVDVDADADGDIDLGDVARFQPCFSSSGVPAGSSCGH